LLGFDIIIDSQSKPWLLEVNSSPALSVDCKIDEMVKPKLIKDIVDICINQTKQEVVEKKSMKFMLRRKIKIL